MGKLEVSLTAHTTYTSKPEKNGYMYIFFV